MFGINSAGYLNVDHHTGIIVAYVTAIVGGAMLNISVPLFFVRNSSPPSFSIFFYPFHRSTFITHSVFNIVYFFGEFFRN